MAAVGKRSVESIDPSAIFVTCFLWFTGFVVVCSGIVFVGGTNTGGGIVVVGSTTNAGSSIVVAGSSSVSSYKCADFCSLFAGNSDDSTGSYTLSLFRQHQLFWSKLHLKAVSLLRLL